MNFLFSMKQCTTCQSEKPLSEFSKVGRNSDKYKNSCKSCTAAKAREYRKAKRLDPEWVNKERKRGREKYIRLEYKARQKEWDKNKPWKQSSTLKNLSRYFKVAKGQELHHWSYNKEHLKDVYLMSPSQHAQAHLLIEFDPKEWKYKTPEGVLLDTKKQHHEYLTKKGIEFIAYSVTKQKR